MPVSSLNLRRADVFLRTSNKKELELIENSFKILKNNGILYLVIHSENN